MSNEDTQKIHAAAFRALQSAGFRHDDPNLAALFELSSIKIVDGLVAVPPSFSTTAFNSKPDLFVNALTLSASEFQAAVGEMDRRHRLGLLAASDRRDADRIAAKYNESG